MCTNDSSGINLIYEEVLACLEEEAAGVGQVSDLLGASVGKRAGWEETGKITDPSRA